LVSARTSPDPALLKPNPYLLNEAVVAVDVSANGVAFVGDSPTDIEAAHAEGTISIGYANKTGKVERLSASWPDVITTSMTHLVDAVRAA
jgi:phosphoglycolate phosphatase